MTNAEIKKTLATLDQAMKACTAVSPSSRPNLVRNACTCPTCKPRGGKR
ncbi:hypothetical protein [Nonomuraea turcica]|nr:hypothetical protein [Nonomuraea sp. G32]MDP4501127.1 hypothetical protein [Nonomuraea sp. G32]